MKVSSSNTLWDFKLRLVEALSIHPKNADVHIRLDGTWQKLTNDEASLAGEGYLLACLCPATALHMSLASALCTQWIPRPCCKLGIPQLNTPAFSTRL